MESGGKPNPGFPPLSTGLGNRCRDSHISTTPATVRLNRKSKKKGDILGYRLGPSPGSSLDWKTLPGCTGGPFVQFEREGNLIQPFAAIVPLYNKIRLTFLDVQSWLNRLHSVITIAIPPKIPYYWDVGLCLSNNYKTWIRENPAASPELKQEVLMAAHPRFIWRCALKIGPFDLLHVIFDATGIARSFPVHSISWWHADLAKIVRHILSEPTSETTLKQILTIKFFELLKASVISEKPMVLQTF